MFISRVQMTDAALLRDFAERTFREAYEDLNNPQDFQAYCEKAFDLAQLEAEIRHPHSTFWLAAIRYLI